MANIISILESDARDNLSKKMDVIEQHLGLSLYGSDVSIYCRTAMFCIFVTLDMMQKPLTVTNILHLLRNVPTNIDIDSFITTNVVCTLDEVPFADAFNKVFRKCKQNFGISDLSYVSENTFKSFMIKTMIDVCDEYREAGMSDINIDVPRHANVISLNECNGKVVIELRKE